MGLRHVGTMVVSGCLKLVFFQLRLATPSQAECASAKSLEVYTQATALQTELTLSGPPRKSSMKSRSPERNEDNSGVHIQCNQKKFSAPDPEANRRPCSCAQGRCEEDIGKACHANIYLRR